MLQYEELRLKLLESEKPLNELADAIGLKELESEIEKLTAQTAEDGFWNDVANSNKIMQKLAGLKSKVKKYTDLKTDFEDTLTLIEMCNEEEDESGLEECVESVTRIEKEIEAQKYAPKELIITAGETASVSITSKDGTRSVSPQPDKKEAASV